MAKLIYMSILCWAALQLNVTAQVIYVNNAGGQRSSDSSIFHSLQNPDLQLQRIPIDRVQLLPGLFQQRYQLNKKYMMSLDNDKMLQNFYYEAGISKTGYIMLNKDMNHQDFYWGWESPNNQLRGHFLGHWLSAAAYLIAQTGDMEVKGKADKIVTELAECQRINGGQWAGSIPEKYFDLMAQGQQIWSPQYTIHKTLMGLWDMYLVTGSIQALEVLDRFADWFHAWTGMQIAANNAAAIYGGEASGMLEIWANLYNVAQHPKYLDLMQRYGHPGMFQALLSGQDVLSNDHANAGIPWSHGAARVYEVTGNQYWRDIVHAFWKSAVTDRGHYCTGGQNAGEYWIPPHKLADFRCQNNQEHCTVYNMIRTADYLYRWTGDPAYADYIERNIYNGILAQQHPHTGMVAYFLPMAAGFTKGGEKGWGTPTMDFWCCHGSLVQAQVRYLENIYYQSNRGLTLAQYIPSRLKWQNGKANVEVRQECLANVYDKAATANRWRMKITIAADEPTNLDLRLRLPWWLTEKAKVTVNGVSHPVSALHGYVTITRQWHHDEILVEFPTRVTAVPMPDAKNLYALMEGPIVLAGLIDREVSLRGNVQQPESFVEREYEHEYKVFPWKQSHYRTVNQPTNFRFVPLYEVADERYSIYFPVHKP